MMDIFKVILTSLLSIVAMFVITKFIGHKQISQLDFFDYVNGITIGSIAAELATELEKPWKSLIAMIVYALVAIVLNLLMNKIPRIRKFINGTPTIVMSGGKIYRNNLKKAKLDLSEFLVMCREQGYFNLNDIATAVFEYNGKLTILPVSTKRPANPLDFNIIPEVETIFTEVIMDGRILDGNLKRLGLDTNWLKKELECRGIKGEKNVFLAVCDNNNQITVFENE